MNWNNIPFFQFGPASPTSEAPPLGIISGLLLFDSGEAENTFLFRCQDRYLTYNALCGMQTVLFVTGRQHKDNYLELLDGHARKLDIIAHAMHLELPRVSRPFFVPLDPESLEIDEESITDDWLQENGLAATPRRAIIFNQVSPTCLRLARQLESVLRRHHRALEMDMRRAAQVSDLALKFHNKAEYVSLVESAPACDLPPHARTAVLELPEFFNLSCWEELIERVSNSSNHAHPEAYYVKSSFDSGGNVARRFSRTEFDENMFSLRSELLGSIDRSEDAQERDSRMRELKVEISRTPSLNGVPWTDDVLSSFTCSQATKRKNIKLLVQEAVENHGRSRNFHGIGFTCFIDHDGSPGQMIAAGQLYRDPDRRHFLGSYLAPDETQMLEQQMDDPLRNLCKLFAQQGYRGPLNFDAVEGQDGRFVFVFDCNPRLTAVYPALAVRTFLQSLGIPVSTIISTGYRGELIYSDIQRTLRRLDDIGLLFRPDRGRGVLLLPNAYRTNGFDALLVNMQRAEMSQILASGALHQSAEPCSSSASEVY